MIFEYLYKSPTDTGDSKKAPLLLLLHGRGADEHDLFGLAPYLDARFFVASARAPIATPYGGYEWFELNIGIGGDVSVSGRQVAENVERLKRFVGQLVREHDLDAGRVFLCGFSQGAIMSLGSALGEPEKFAAVVAMSGRAMPEMLPADGDFGALTGFPILVTHGLYDAVLPIENGRATREILSRLPVELDYREYPMAHEISPESLRDVTGWLSRRLDKFDAVKSS